MHAAKLRYGETLALTLAMIAIAGSRCQAAAITTPSGATIETVDFERHVAGLLGRMGCNAGACHGSFQGKGGLYLSLFGYSAEKDFLAFTRDNMGRRINVVSPDESLLLLKATGQVPHGGGKRFDKGSWQYTIFREWIASGATRTTGSGIVKKLEVFPAEHTFAKPNETKQLKVMVEFADGSRADMTPFADFRVNDDYVAEVSPAGVVKGLRPGDTAIVISYRGNVLSGRALVPAPAAANFVYPKQPEVNFIDKAVFAKLRKLNVVPSDLSSDTEFLRRITIDTIGCLPTPEEVRAFIADKNPNKRTMKIDELLSHPMHAALWATKFSDITGNNIDTLEQPQDLRPKRSKMWHDWFRVRFAENVPYDQIVKGVLCATSRDGKTPEEWVSLALAIDEAAAKGFETDYAKRTTLDMFWRKNNQMLEQLGEHTAAAFMGIRLECAQCHKHPFDRWTQIDYRSYANVFGQVRFATSPEAKPAIDKANADLKKAAEEKKNNRQVNQIREVYIDSRARPRTLQNPDTNQALSAKALGGPEIAMSGDAREALYKWLVEPQNPFFARSFVNRVWGHYFGIGLVEPVDNFSVANPPSNEVLLNALARSFVESKFNIRELERAVLLSRTYQLSATPNESNVHDRNNYARSYVRRLMAEVVVDVLNSALEVKENFGNDVPPNSRAIEVAPSRVQNGNLAFVFRIFGRPPRTSSCDCERASEPALPQTLYLMTDQTVTNKITSGRLKKLIADKKSNEQIVEELFLATLTRFPSHDEKQWAVDHVQDKKDRQAAFVDVAWALINTREFILNH